MGVKTGSNKFDRWPFMLAAMVIAAIVVGASWYTLDRSADRKHQAMAVTLAQMLAQQAADQLLADDKLALQNIVRRTSQLPSVHYAGIYDAAGTPLSESGTVAGIADTFTASAPVFTQATQVGIASVSLQTPEDYGLFWLLILPLVCAPLGLLYRSSSVTAPSATNALADFNGLEPLLCLSIQPNFSKPGYEAAIERLKEAAVLIARFYSAAPQTQLNQTIYRFDPDKDPTTRASCMARLWYGAVQQLRAQTGFELKASAILTTYPTLTGSPVQQGTEHNNWMLELNDTAAKTNGVIISYDFMAQPGAAESLVVRDSVDHYRLKSLKPTLDKLVRKQLAQVVKVLNNT